MKSNVGLWGWACSNTSLSDSMHCMVYSGNASREMAGASGVINVTKNSHEGKVGDNTGKNATNRLDKLLDALNNMKRSKVGLIEYDENENPIYTEITDSDETVISDVPVNWFEKYFSRKKTS